MATSFSDQYSEPVIVVLPTGKTARWRQFSQIAQPSGIAFSYRLDPTGLSASILDAETTQWADAFNQKALVSGVKSIRTYSDVNDNDMIDDRLVVTVQSDNGRFVDEIDMPQSLLQSSVFNDRVEALREELNAEAAL